MPLRRKTEATARRLNLAVSKPQQSTRLASQGARRWDATAQGIAPLEELDESLSQSEQAKAHAQLAADKTLVLAQANLRQQKAVPGENNFLSKPIHASESDNSLASSSNGSGAGINSDIARNESGGLLTEQPAASEDRDKITGGDFGRPRSADSRVIQVTESGDDENMTGSGTKPGSLNMDKLGPTRSMNDKRLML